MDLVKVVDLIFHELLLLFLVCVSGFSQNFFTKLLNDMSKKFVK